MFVEESLLQKMRPLLFRYSCKSTLYILLALAISGCAAPANNPGLMIYGIVFHNQSATTIRDVQIFVKKTGAFAQCSQIYTNNECSTTFRSKPYQGNPVTISWRQADIVRSSEFRIPAPDVSGTEKQLRVHISIQKNGLVTAELAE